MSLLGSNPIHISSREDSDDENREHSTSTEGIADEHGFAANRLKRLGSFLLNLQTFNNSCVFMTCRKRSPSLSESSIDRCVNYLYCVHSCFMC